MAIPARPDFSDDPVMEDWYGRLYDNALLAHLVSIPGGLQTFPGEKRFTGVTTFGGGDAGHRTNYSTFEEDGTYRAVGDAVIWDDQQVNLGVVGVGASAPTWTAWKGGKVLAFDKAQSNLIYFNMQLTHKYKAGTSIEFHLHTAPADAGIGTVGWVMTVSLAAPDEVFPTATTFSAVQTIATGQDVHRYFTISEDIGSTEGLSSILVCSLYRDGTAGVVASDTYDDDIYLTALDAHIECDTIGSRERITK